jgi:hypothetical protein
MAGGIFTSQNKVLPGVYINTKSSGNVTANIGTKGVVAICEPLSWGATGVISKYTPGEDPTPLIGSDITSDDALFLREMMKGSDVTTAPIQILLYRPTGASGVKATATIGALTVTAKYVGTRGNDITIIISADPDTSGNYIIETSIDGRIADAQSVANLSSLVSNDWVDFTGTGTTITTTAGTALTTGANPTVSTTDYSAFLTALEPYTFDIVCYDGADSTVRTAMASFVERVSNSIGKKCQAVLSGGTAINSEWVINVNNGVKLADGTALTAAQATWWVAGAEAGAQYNQSLTYAQYPGAVEANPKKTNAQVEEAVLAGDIVFIDDFDIVKICTDINTLTTVTPTKGKEFKKNRVMRTLNQICNDFYEHISNYFIGKVDNNASGRNLMKGWCVGYLNEMQANNGIQNFTSQDIEVLPGSDIDAVVINVGIQPVDSVEKIYTTITVSVASE